MAGSVSRSFLDFVWCVNRRRDCAGDVGPVTLKDLVGKRQALLGDHHAQNQLQGPDDVAVRGCDKEPFGSLRAENNGHVIISVIIRHP